VNTDVKMEKSIGLSLHPKNPYFSQI